MPPLHLVNKPPQLSDALARCLSVAQHGGDIVLYEQGALAAEAPTLERALASSGNADPKATIYALREDFESLCGRAPHERVSLIDDAQFVELCCRNQASVSWS